MPRRARGWSCTRQTAGKKCNTLNPPGTRKCRECGKARPAKRRPKHMAALNTTYEEYIELNGGEHCAICDRPPTPGRRLDRDHAHTVNALGEPRGLLCHDCNRHLGHWYTIPRLERMLRYLRRHEERMRLLTDEEEAVL